MTPGTVTAFAAGAWTISLRWCDRRGEFDQRGKVKFFLRALVKGGIIASKRVAELLVDIVTMTPETITARADRRPSWLKR